MRIAVDGVIFQLQAGRAAGVSRIWRHILPELTSLLGGHDLILLQRQGTTVQFPGWRTVAVPTYQLGPEPVLEQDDRMLQEVCTRLGIDVFLSTYFTRAPGVRNVLMVYDLIPEVMGWDLNQPEWLSKQRAVATADHLVAISHSTWHDLLHFYPTPPGKSSVALCGPAPEFRPRPLGAVAALRQALGLRKPYLIMVGSRALYKNSAPVFAALAAMPEAEQPSLLLVGGEAFPLPAEAPYAGRVECVVCPRLDDEQLAIAYAGAQALIYPSRYEGFGLPPLEAMASGCPVIVGHNSSLPEVVGEAALYADPDRAESLGAAVQQVARTDVRVALAAAGIERARRFSWRSMAATLAPHILRVPATHWSPLREAQRPSTPPAPSAVPAGKLNEVLAAADRAYAAGNLVSARDLMKEAVELAPKALPLLETLGSLHFRLGESRDAFGLFERARQIEPNRVDLLVKHAAAAAACQETEAFETSLGKALEIAPQHPAALRLLADLNLSTGRYLDAAQTYQRLLRVAPPDTGMLLALGKCFYQLGEVPMARESFIEVLRLEAGNGLAVEALRLIEHQQLEANFRRPVPEGSRLNDRLWLGRELTLEAALQGEGSVRINGIPGFLMEGDMNFLFSKAQALPPGARALEIGSFMGLSAIVFVHGFLAAGNREARLYCVDTWRGSEEHQNLRVVQEDALFDRFLSHIRQAGVESMITPVREASTKAAARFEDRSLDYIFVDGDHSFEGCYADLVAWYPKLKPGGVFIGHDCTPNEGVHQALQKFARERQLQFVITPPPSAHYVFEVFAAAPAELPAPAPTVSSAPVPPPVPPSSETSAEPIVSAIVSAYKSERFIRGCLEDLEAQTIADRLEIIVVDTASPENEGSIVKEFQQRYRNIQYLRTEQRETVYGAWNRGLRAARGKYITNANTDDRHRRDHLEILVRNLEQNPDVALAYADVLITRTENETFDTAHPTGTYHWLDFKPLDLLTKGCFVGPQPVWRRSLHDTHGYFDDTFVTAGDYEFWLRIASRQRFLHVKETLGLYLESPGSVEHTNRDRGARECQEAQNRHREAILAISPKPAPGAPPLVAPLKAVSDLRLPKVGEVGRLKSAYDFLAQRKLEQAWQATLTALTTRPFHPEAFVLLGEIAEAAGDWRVARQCAERAQDMAPAYALPKQLLKRLRNNQGKAAKWARLPQALLGSVPRLSVCVIAKNEEKFLARCLDSIKPIAHQIVLVDTGSTDGTVKLAEERGAEIHHFTWNDDFSDARNEALKHATGDWILVLDADEELPAAEHSKLQADMREKGIMGYRLPLLNHGAESEGVCYVPRLFRNAPGLFFFGRVHEQIFPSILARCSEWGLETKLGSATLMHYGYTAEVTQSRQKVERNLRLLRQAVLEWPDEPNVLMNLGLELVRSGELDEGLSYYRQALFKMGQQPAELHVPELRETLLTQLASHLHRAKAYEEIVQTLNTSVAKAAGLTSTLHWVLGLAYFELKRLPEAAEQMRQCIAKRQQPCLSPVNRDVLTGAPHHCLAMCLLKLGDHDAAEKQLLAALKESPGSRPILKDYAKFLADRGRPVEALQQLLQLVNQQTDDVAVWLYGAQIALSRPEFLEFAVDWTGQASQHLPDHPQVGHQRAEALMLTGDAPGALALWRRFPLEDTAAQAAQLVLGELVSGASPGLVAAHLEPGASQRFIQWYRHLVQFGASQVIATINANLNGLAAALPSAATALRQVVAEAEAG